MLKHARAGYEEDACLLYNRMQAVQKGLWLENERAAPKEHESAMVVKASDLHSGFQGFSRLQKSYCRYQLAGCPLILSPVWHTTSSQAWYPCEDSAFDGLLLALACTLRY